MTNNQKPTQVAKIETSQEAVEKPQAMWSAEQVELIKNTVAKGATNDELKLFLYTAKRTCLDPLTKQIHFVKRGGQMTVQTGIDGYRAIAERTGQLAGIDDAVYEIENKKPVKATVTVYRMVSNQRVGFTASARWSEYAPSGNQAFMWNKMPFLMLTKCAEALALRKAFPNDLSGLYTNEEMGQADQPITETVEAPKKKEVSKKTQIAHLMKLLNIPKEEMTQKIVDLTRLDVKDEANHDEIISRLTMIVQENKQN